MIESLKIENFKGIGKCFKDDLSRINLLIGRNNSCKSTVLEAIYYTLREFDGRSELSNLLGRRSNVYSGAQELWYRYATKEKIVLRFSFGDVNLGLNLLVDEPTSQIKSQIVTFTKNGPDEYIFDGNFFSRDFEITRGMTFHFGYLGTRAKSIGQDIIDFVHGAELVESTSKNDVESIERVLGEIKNNNRAKEFGDCLEDIFGVGKNWEFLPHPNRPKEFRVAFYDRGVPLYLSGFGDGIRYATQFITKLMLTKNSILLIEELESNQHLESLKKLIPLLVRLSLENNIQIFATTQSPFVWRLFEHEFDDDKKRSDSFRAFHVKREPADGTLELFQQTKENANEFWMSVDKDISGSP